MGLGVVAFMQAAWSSILIRLKHALSVRIRVYRTYPDALQFGLAPRDPVADHGEMVILHRPIFAESEAPGSICHS